MARDDAPVAAATEPVRMRKPPGEGRVAAIFVAVLLIAIVVVGFVLIAIGR